MKVRPTTKLMCRNCKIAVRRGKMYITCKSDPKHKQRQG